MTGIFLSHSYVVGYGYSEASGKGVVKVVVACWRGEIALRCHMSGWPHVIRGIFLVEVSTGYHFVEQTPAVRFGRIHFKEGHFGRDQTFGHEPAILRIAKASRREQKVVVTRHH